MENIRRGTYRLTIGEIRKALAAGEKERAAKLKKTLPAFTPQATYTKKRLNPYITGYNQLVILDIDHVGERELERITPLATEAPYTVAYFRSPSGDGAKLIAYAATDETATPGNHRRVYEAMSRWYAARLGVELDTSGSDIGRLCFVSDDPALYLSPAYRPWLEGTGEVPEGLDPLPLTWKEEVSKTAPGTKKRKMASPLEKARRTAERKGAYAEGNRNNFIFVMATRANRLGVKQAEMEAYAATAFADLPADERLAALAEHMSTHNTPFSTGAIHGMLKDMVNCIKELLMDGKNVKIDDLGIFSVGIRSKGAATPEDFSTQGNIIGVRLRARATGNLSSASLKLTAKLPDYTEYSNGEVTPGGGGGDSESPDEI